MCQDNSLIGEFMLGGVAILQWPQSRKLILQLEAFRQSRKSEWVCGV
jgi:hypothetical protein